MKRERNPAPSKTYCVGQSTARKVTSLRARQPTSPLCEGRPEGSKKDPNCQWYPHHNHPLPAFPVPFRNTLPPPPPRALTRIHMGMTMTSTQAQPPRSPEPQPPTTATAQGSTGRLTDERCPNMGRVLETNRKAPETQAIHNANCVTCTCGATCTCGGHGSRGMVKRGDAEEARRRDAARGVCGV